MPLASAFDTQTLTAPPRAAVASVARVRPSVPQGRSVDQVRVGWWRGGQEGSVTIDDDRSVAAMSRRIRLRTR
jgi:hypothetical protein